MIAKIRKDNGFYNSIVFAIFDRGWNSQVIVFNQDYTALQLVKIWKRKRNVYIYNTEKGNDWVENKKVKGYKWVLENITRKLFRTEINQSILPKGQEMQANVEQLDWFELKNKYDVEGLMEIACCFHDAYVKDMYIESGKQYILFDTTWSCEILFELDGNVETNLIKNFGCIAIGNTFPTIFDSAIFFENNMIYWVDDSGCENSSDLDKSEFRYFCANQVKWKPIIQ